MNGIVLAAGRGSRLGALTDGRPKCLTPLLGRPLLAWQLDALHAAGVRQVTVVGGYRKECLAGGDYALLENPRWAATNMVATLECAAERLRAEPAVVSYSDIVYHPSAVRSLAQAAGDIAITYDRNWAELWGARFEDPLADAESFRVSGDRVVEIGRRAASMDEIQGQYMGLLRFTPAGWIRVETLLSDLSAAERDRLDMTSLLRSLIDSGAEIHAVPVNGGWCEVDNETDLRLYERRIREAEEEGERWSHDWREHAAW